VTAVSWFKRYVERDVERDPMGIYSFVPALSLVPVLIVGALMILFGLSGIALIVAFGLAGLISIAGLLCWLTRSVQRQFDRLPPDLLSREYRDGMNDHG
jgi:hypothetical protein